MKHNISLYGIVIIYAVMFSACSDDLKNELGFGHEIAFEIEPSSTVTTRSATEDEEIEPQRCITETADTFYLHTYVTNINDSILQPKATTRGAQKDVSNLQSDGFNVSAYNTSDGTTKGSAYFEFLTATYAASKFTPQSAGNKKYWPAGKLMFYAYYPAATVSNGITQGSDATTLTYSVPSTPANHPDLMTAKLDNQQYSSGDGTSSLTFNHALCAIKFQTGTDIAGGTINSITFNNIYTSGTYNLDTQTWDFTGKSRGNVSYSLSVSTTEGTANTAILTGNNTLMMIPQTLISTSSVTMDYTDAYGINLQLSVSLSGTSWTAGQCVTYNVGGVHGITKVSDQTRNPLWYVARYNMNQNGTFDKSHNNASQGDWRFSWDTATAAFAGGSTSRNGYYTQGLAISNVDSDESSYRFHLPTVQEWYSIMPILSSTNSPNYNIVIGISSNAIGEGLQTEKASVFHHANAHTATSYQSYWGEESSTTRYAIRFLGTNYCSVWQYRILGTFESSASSVARLEMKSEVIDAISASNTNKLKAVIDALKNNKYVWSSNAVTRTFYGCGYHGETAGAVNYEQGTRGLYMSATIDPAYTVGGRQTCFYMNFWATSAYTVSHQKGHGLSVRLFKD